MVVSFTSAVMTGLAATNSLKRCCCLARRMIYLLCKSLRQPNKLHKVVSAVKYLIIHIGDIHHKVDIELEVVAHDAPDNVGAHIVPSMT